MLHSEIKKLTDRIKNYYKGKKRITIFIDALFYLFIILMLIPPTRKRLSSLILRGSLHQPVFMSVPDQPALNSEDYNWQIVSMSGTNQILSKYKGEVIFLNFWATWCPPCIAEMPSIQRLYDEYGEKVVFLLVTTDNEANVSKFLEKNNYSFPIHFQATKETKPFGHNSIPVTFIISKDGKIELKEKGATKWDGRKIKKMLDKLIKE